MTASIKTALFALTLAALAPNPAVSVDEYNVSNGVTLAGVPLGVHGFDPVVLSTVGGVARGDAANTVVHDGVAYYFASPLSADRFSADPEAYLPQFGGFCAYAIALGKKFDGDPRFADIVDGKLYLFVNAEIFAKYLANKEQILADAVKKWPQIRSKPVSEL